MHWHCRRMRSFARTVNASGRAVIKLSQVDGRFGYKISLFRLQCRPGGAYANIQPALSQARLHLNGARLNARRSF